MRTGGGTAVVAWLPLLLSALVTFSPVTASGDCPSDTGCPRTLFLDVHELEPGSVTAEDVAAAHLRDLAVQERRSVAFHRYWVDERAGLIVCLSEAPDAESVIETHREAHGLVPHEIHAVVDGEAAPHRGNGRLFLDVHVLGPGNVTAEAVAKAHERDLAVQHAHGVNFVQYWVDEERGVVTCLSEAPDAEAVRATHEQAHGLLPDRILEVIQGE